jgi:hypothetical protein
MATKQDPGSFDCYAKAAPDEPLFVLLARDSLAPELVEVWAERREAAGNANPVKLAEARACAASMREWKARTQQ